MMTVYACQDWSVNRMRIEGSAVYFSDIGLIHAYEPTPAVVATRFGLFEAPEFAASYLLLFVPFLAARCWERE
jgi:hypothetical protein